MVRHYDTWDCIENQSYFSFEAFSDVLSQIFSLQRTPDLPGPEFTLLQCVLSLLNCWGCR